MKIAYFTDTYLPQVNGVTNTLDKLGTYLKKSNIEYRFFAPEYPQANTTALDDCVNRFRSISLPIYPECRLSVPIYAGLRTRTDKFKPDLIHIVTPLFIGLSGLRYARERRIPIVTSYHTNFDEYLKYYKLDYLEDILWNYFKWFHGFGSINFCPSGVTLETLNAKGIENLRIWSRGIDNSKFNPSFRNEEMRKNFCSGSRRVFLYVGRLAAEKNLDILMKSIEIVNQTHQDRAVFVLTGDGPYAKHLKTTAPSNVIFTGYLRGKDLSAVYASSDVFAFPSGTETFGNVVLEAMSSGLPVISANTGGVRDSVINNYNGFMCSTGDAGGFAESMIRLIDDSSLLQAMSANAREFTLTRTWDSIFDKLVNDYNTILADNYYNIGIPA